MADTQSRPTGPPLDQDDELCHQVCCRDDNRALCGRDVTEATWRLKGSPSFDCVVCEDLNQASYCPIVGACPGIPFRGGN